MAKTKVAVILESLKLITVEPFIFFTLFGYSVRLVSYQSLLMDRACRNIFEYSDDICNDIDNHHPEQVSSMEVGNNCYTMDMLCLSLPAIVVGIFVGPWSDKYSRKYPLIICATGMVLEGLGGAILTLFSGISPFWYPNMALLSGVTGGITIGISISGSYISDITDERSRPSRFAVLEFFIIVAVVLGSVLGGQIFETYGYLPVMCITPVSFVCGLLYVIFIVKETKPPVPEDKRYTKFRDILRIDNIKQSYKTCSRERAGNIRLQIWSLVWIGFSQKFVEIGALGIAFVFAKKMYKWGVTEFSNISTIVYVVEALVTIGVIPLLSNKLRLHEAAIGLVGVLSMMSRLALASIAYTPLYFYLASISGSLFHAAGIAVRSRLSKLVNKEELGRAFSFLGICESIAPLIGTVVFIQIYNASLNIFPGMAFAFAGVFLLPSAVIFGWMMKMPTISLAEYAREEEMKNARPLEPISSEYKRMEEEIVY